ncbi:MAG: gamma-glutamyltransferase [Sphingomonadales bacterium]
MRALISFFLSLAIIMPAGAQGPAAADRDTPIYDAAARHQPVVAAGGMVVSQEALASRIGADILARGGNAVDAAVAVGFALAVTLPRAGNLGGGGFMLVHLAQEGRTIAIDYREMAPAAATRDMFLGPDGKVDQQKSRFSHQAAGVPGTVAGLLHALERYGTMSVADVIAPAIKLAADGMTVSYDLAQALTRARERLAASDAAAAIFLPRDGAPPRPGDTLVQSDLAWSLGQIRDHGRDGFYGGALAARIAADMRAHGGLITEADLAAYRVAEREPVKGSYRGHDVVLMPPPSSGGVHVLQILNTIEADDVAAMGAGSANAIHLLAEAMKQAYADRAEYLGDPDFIDVPVAALIAKDYGARIRQAIDMTRARPAAAIGPGLNLSPESPQTTHFSVMDRAGNAVANTYTLNFSYGSGRAAAGTGILLNNEMDDFAAKEGVPNAFGLLGDDANAIAPGKRPLSSMTPLIVMKNGKPWLVSGTPGGSTIITTMVQVIVNMVDFGMNAADAAAAPRFHHQWRPDRLMIEPGFSPDTLRLLQARGHDLFPRNFVWGAVQSVVHEHGLFFGAADPRRPASLAVGVE